MLRFQRKAHIKISWNYRKDDFLSTKIISVKSCWSIFFVLRFNEVSAFLIEDFFQSFSYLEKHFSFQKNYKWVHSWTEWCIETWWWWWFSLLYSSSSIINKKWSHFDTIYHCDRRHQSQSNLIFSEISMCKCENTNLKLWWERCRQHQITDVRRTRKRKLLFCFFLWKRNFNREIKSLSVIRTVVTHTHWMENDASKTNTFFVNFFRCSRVQKFNNNAEVCNLYVRV